MTFRVCTLAGLMCLQSCTAEEPWPAATREVTKSVSMLSNRELDVLFVVSKGSTMVEERFALAANLDYFIAGLALSILFSLL